MPQKLDDCVNKVKGEKGTDSAYAICNASINESIIQEKVNGNRQVPVFNPPIKTNKVEPKVDKTRKNIGGTQNFMTTNMWKQILDSQLKRNVKEPRY